MDTLVIVVAVVALLAGGLIGWLFASREGAAAKQTVDNLRMQLDEVVRERDANRTAAQELAALRAAQEERERAFEQQIAALKEAKESLSAQFHEIAGKLLGDARKQFLDQANDRFTQAIQPVQDILKRYEEGLHRVEKEREGSYRELNKAVELLHASHTAVKEETARLVNALRSSPKARGRWGEQTLKNVLEQAGLTEGVDFETEVSVDTEDGRLRPDVIVNLPGGRKLVIDAKCSLNAYLDASECTDDTTRLNHLKLHATSMRTHAQQLGSKKYWDQFGESADYVVMFIPGEHFLTAALEQDDQLWQWAFERKVLLATPTNLVAIARTVASVWKQQRLSEAAEEIAALGKELHSRLGTMAQHMERVGKNLQTANTAYNQMVGSFESQVLTQARRFETLGAGSAKSLDTPPIVEASPRPLTKIAPTNPPDEEPPQLAAE